MSYSSGTFSLLTAYNPVVTGTTISATAFNATMSDVATGLSTALLKDGTQTATAQIPFAQGLSVGTKFAMNSSGTTNLSSQMAISAVPSSLGSDSSYSTAFSGDLSHCQFAIGQSITGTGTLQQPTTGYSYTNEAYPHFTFLNNSSGWNQGTADNTGRTAACAYRTVITHSGNGDAVCFDGKVTVTGTKAGSTSFLANPAGVLYNGDVHAGIAGAYLNPSELLLKDEGYDAAGVGHVVNLVRTVNTGAKYAWWAGVRIQSQGSKEIDVAFSAYGPAVYGLDLSFLTLTATQAAITLSANQRIYGNVSATDASGLSRFPSGLGTGEWFEYNSVLTAWKFLVNNATAAQFAENLATFNKAIAIADGMTAPTATVGFAKIFVDTADGDLKVIFGDGTTKTIVTD